MLRASAPQKIDRMHLPPVWSRSMPRHTALVACLLALSVEMVALFLGADASWDTRNYHLYDPFALLNKPFGVDIAPAHHQSFFSPTMDLPFYLLTRHVPNTAALNALLAIPHAVALVLAFLLTCRLMQARRPIELWIAGVAVAFSAAGASSAPTLATAMDEMLPSCLFLGGLLTLLPADAARWPTPRRIFIAGLLAGAACGLKLTFSYASAALGLVVLLVPWPRDWRSLLARPILLGAGGFIGAALLTGYWWVLNWQHYGNPLFPMMNNIFRSPWTDPVSWVDTTYLPRSLGEALGAPWVWALQLWLRGGESRLRDPRFALAVLAAVLCLAQLVLPRRLGLRPAWPVTFAALWFLVAFGLWRYQFSIFRYLSLLELFTGPLIALAIMPATRRLGAAKPALAGMALLMAAVSLITVYPTVIRAPIGAHPLQVTMQELAPGDVVLLLDTTPMAYLALFQDARVRFVGTNDYFMKLTRAENPMQPLVAAAIADAHGALWGLETPAEWPGQADQTLSAYGLIRGSCEPIASSMSPNPARMCRLHKTGPVGRVQASTPEGTSQAE